MSHQDGPTPETIRERVSLAEAEFAAVENVNLATSSPAALIVALERAKGSWADMIRLHHERDAA